MKSAQDDPTPENPFGKCLYFTANAVARHISKLAEASFARSGLCPSGALLLKLVIDRPGISPSEAAGILHLAPSSVTRFADGLSREELITRQASGRQQLLHPTDAGKKRLEEVVTCWHELYQRYTDTVGSERAEKVAIELAEIAELLDS